MIKLTPDSHDGDYLIQTYRSDEIVINDTSYHDSVLLSANHLESTGLPKSMATLNAEHINKILALKPAVVIIGSGQHYQSLPPEFSQQFLCQGIGVEVMTTAAACRTFTVLLAEGRNAVALLII